MTDPQRAVIPILPYKVLSNPTKCLVSAHTLLGERLTIALFSSLGLSSGLLSVCLFYNCTVSHGCPQGIGPVSIAVNSQFLQRDLPESNVHTLGVCHTCEALAYWVTHIPLSQKITMTDPQRAVIPILPYKVLSNPTKCLVSAHALLSERLTSFS